MVHHGDHRARTYTDRFGPWREALDEGGLDLSDTQAVSTDALIADLHRLRDELGEEPTSTDVAREGEYGLATYRRRFGSWGEAVAAAFADRDDDERTA